MPKESPPLPPWEDFIEEIKIVHPTMPMNYFIIKRNKFGTYWMENQDGEGTQFYAFKLYDFLEDFVELDS